MEAEKAAKKLSDDGSLRKAAETLAKQQQVNGTEKSDDDEDDDDDEFRSENKAALKKATAELDSVQELQRKAERRKTFLMQLIAMRIGSAPRIKYVFCFTSETNVMCGVILLNVCVPYQSFGHSVSFVLCNVSQTNQVNSGRVNV